MTARRYDPEKHHRRSIRLRGTPGTPVWQRNYYERIIRNERALNAVREYIHNNPANWGRDIENPARVEQCSPAVTTKRRHHMALLQNINAFIIDMDGVLYRGEAAIPGAAGFLALLREQGKKFLLLTNNSTRTPAQYVEKLARMGIQVDQGHIFTSAQATALYLRQVARPGSRVYLVGMDGIREALLAEGFTLTDGTDVDFVVVGMDTTVTYEKLKKATLAIRAGARFIATNPDRTLPTEEGIVPGAGSILAAIETATGVKPTIVGKPQKPIFDIALKRLGSRPEETAVIGDRLETDILGGIRSGLKTILVLSGVTTREDLAGDPTGRSRPEIKPHWVFESVKELAEELARHWRGN